MLKFLRRSDEETRAKTESAVNRSRRGLFGRIRDVFQRSHLDDSIWEELEELLISGDVGVETTLDLVEALRSRARTESMQEPAQVFAALKEELVALLNSKSESSKWTAIRQLRISPPT